MTQKDRRTGKRSGSSAARLDALIAEALLDTTDDSEQRTAFYTILGDSLALPFTTQILGEGAEGHATEGGLPLLPSSQPGHPVAVQRVRSFLDTAVSRPVQWETEHATAGRLRRPSKGRACARTVATPAFSLVGAFGMQWAPLDETSGLDAAANRGTPTDSCCKDIP